MLIAIVYKNISENYLVKNLVNIQLVYSVYIYIKKMVFITSFMLLKTETYNLNLEVTKLFEQFKPKRIIYK